MSIILASEPTDELTVPHDLHAFPESADTISDDDHDDHDDG